MTAPVAVIGAGWAGLAAAVALVEAGLPVRLFEAGPHGGGRARNAPAIGLTVDNGQHLAIGAYSTTFSLLETIGIPRQDVFASLPLVLEQHGPDGLRFALRAPVGASRARIGAAFLAASGMSLADKFAMLRGWRRLLRPATGATVSDSLRVAGQPVSAIRYLWEPLCLATLNTAPHEASAAVFAAVLRESLGARGRGANDLLLPSRPLGDVLPGPALAWLERRDASIHLGDRVTGLVIGDGVTAVSTAGAAHSVSGVIVAVPPDACARLLAPLVAEQGLVERIERIDTRPICTVYLKYPPSVRLDPAMVGMTDTLTQWVIDRRVAGQAGVLAAVISADGPHMELDNDALIARVTDELRVLIPDAPTPSDARVIREKRATFAATPANEALRPAVDAPKTPGIVLAGDWTATGLPATLEGAVRSGYAAARAMMEQA